jgi:hypothetical protein
MTTQTAMAARGATFPGVLPCNGHFGNACPRCGRREQVRLRRKRDGSASTIRTRTSPGSALITTGVFAGHGHHTSRCHRECCRGIDCDTTICTGIGAPKIGYAHGAR